MPQNPSLARNRMWGGHFSAKGLCCLVRLDGVIEVVR